MDDVMDAEIFWSVAVNSNTVNSHSKKSHWIWEKI